MDQAPSPTQTPVPPAVAIQDDLHRPPPQSEFALRWEVVAVLCVAVFPSISWNLMSAYAPRLVSWSTQVPYGISALYNCFLTTCRIVVLMYLIWRSGELWTTFGLGRPRRADLALALVAFFGDLLLQRLFPISHLIEPSPARPRPQQEADYLLMMLMYALGAFEEELVFRGYLITRLTHLFRSRAAALAGSVVLFALVHGSLSSAYSAALAGILYGIIYLWAGRIWPVALGHFLCNIGIAFGVTRFITLTEIGGVTAVTVRFSASTKSPVLLSALAKKTRRIHSGQRIGQVVSYLADSRS